MNQLLVIALSVPAILIVTTIHEFVRAAVSTSLGDQLPKQKKRLTLNPVRSFEPIGFLLMLATNFGWGKPVETSALHYKNRKRDTIITAVMPNVINFIMAIVFLILYKNFAASNVYLSTFLMIVFRYNIWITVYNLLPVSPMDCNKVLAAALPANVHFKLIQYEKIIQMAFLLLLFIGIINFIAAPLYNLLAGICFIIVF